MATFFWIIILVLWCGLGCLGYIHMKKKNPNGPENLLFIPVCGPLLLLFAYLEKPKPQPEVLAEDRKPVSIFWQVFYILIFLNILGKLLRYLESSGGG